jgi:hypothetical protein
VGRERLGGIGGFVGVFRCDSACGLRLGRSVGKASTRRTQGRRDLGYGSCRLLTTRLMPSLIRRTLKLISRPRGLSDSFDGFSYYELPAISKVSIYAPHAGCDRFTYTGGPYLSVSIPFLLFKSSVDDSLQPRHKLFKKKILLLLIK